MKGRTKDKQKFNEEIDVLALFCFRGRAIASGGQIVLTPKRDVLHPVTLRVPQSLLGETTAGATTEGTSLRVCLRHTFGEHQSPTAGNPFGFASCLRRETLLQHWSHRLQRWIHRNAQPPQDRTASLL